jgi:MFS family permease
MKSESGWHVIIIAYALPVLCMAEVGAVAPLIPDLAKYLGASAGQVGFGIALFSMPSAVFAILAGTFIDRIGPRHIILAAAVLGLIGDLIAANLTSISVLYAALITVGCGYGAANIAVPTLFIATTNGDKRVRSMSLYATHAPIGFSSGLLMAAPFAGSDQWPLIFWLHAAITAVIASAAVFLLPVTRPQSHLDKTAGKFRDLILVFRERLVLRLALAASLPSAISYGTSLVSATYLSTTYNVSVAMSASTVAMAKIVAMLLAGLVMGQLLTAKFNSLVLFAVMGILGLCAQFLVFYPGGSYALAAAALMGWLFAFGGMSAITMSLLPQVIVDKNQTAACSGMVGQIMSITSFLTPTIYFNVSGWTAFVTLAAVGLLCSFILLPAWSNVSLGQGSPTKAG